MGTVRDSAVTVVGGGALGAAAAYSLAAAGYRDIQVLEAGDLADKMFVQLADRDGHGVFSRYSIARCGPAPSPKAIAAPLHVNARRCMLVKPSRA